MKRDHITKRFIVMIVTWFVGFVFLGVAITVTLVYLMPGATIERKFTTVIFIILIYCISWVVRGFSSDTKDTLIADMGDIELEVMRAKIEQVLKARKG